MDSQRISFSKIKPIIDIPDLLAVQKESFEDFLQLNIPPAERENKGLQNVFLANFPVLDTKEFFRLDFIEYHIDAPRYSIQECKEKGLTYAAPLKAKLRLSRKDEETQEFVNTVQQEVYLGNLPFMTESATFIINGAERVVVSQLHRSPGVAFSLTHHANGTPLYSARIIPLKGSWVEFATDINHVLYVYIDRKKKFPSTTLLRALNYVADDEILGLFDMFEDVDVNATELETLIGRVVAADVFDMNTGEIFLTRESIINEETIERIREAEVDVIKLIRNDLNTEQDLILNTLKKDSSHTREEALFSIYRQLRTGEAPDLDTAAGLIEKLFFNDKRYDLGEVGRHRMNDKLNLGIPESTTVLTPEDIVAIMKYMIRMKDGKESFDDIDHLGNRRVRTVGEQLQQQFNTGVARMIRTIKERMNMRDTEGFTPQDLVNARTISSVINGFFGTNQLSQFMDQTNPLSELTHKRRMSALGPGGLTRERAGFEVRDVHYTHYGRLCPIETPEGPNIGLISSLTIYARVNKYGFLETPYRKVDSGAVSDQVEYLTAEQEDHFTIAQANEAFEEGKFSNERVKSRFKGDFPLSLPENIQYMDVSPAQIVSAAAALIPFLEHDDANRALMGSNMQRQAVPLIRPEAPVVGTGLEKTVAEDTRAVILAENSGFVEYVDSDKIIVNYDIDPNEPQYVVQFADSKKIEYRLIKFSGTNQETCINQKPIVKPGQKVKKGDVLADGFATDGGELALGRNVLVAFMPWRGYNFEDAIIVSEKLVANDVFTSIHIEEVELQVRETKRGEEELTRDIPNVNEEMIKNLDEHGVIREGAEVKEGDILIGKITPKGESDPTPEEKLLRAIFGDKAGDVKDASLKASPGLRGTIVKTRIFSRRKKEGSDHKKHEQKLLAELEEKHKRELSHLFDLLGKKLALLCSGKKTLGIRDQDGSIVVKSGVEVKDSNFADHEVIARLDFHSKWFDSEELNNFVTKLYKNFYIKQIEIDELYKRAKAKIQGGDELPPGIVQLAKVYIAKKRKISVGDKMAGRHGNKGVVSKVVPMEDMPFLPDGTPIEMILNPLGVPSRMNIGQLYETALGWVGKKLGVKFATPVFDGAKVSDVEGWLEQAELPAGCKTQMIDGRTGEFFHQPVTVGYIYMLKLSHMVDDKIHARAIGPYSLITQQPLGGKAQFGGQRFGEMEVWALEAYGASHILQEILTVKSDDVSGRAKVYEAIVKGENISELNVPESFNVLIKELQGLGLDIKKTER